MVNKWTVPISRVNAVTGSLNGQQTSYVSGVNYAPQGTPSLYLYGNPGTGSKQLARTINYNSRLQWASADDEINQDPGYNLLHQVYIWSTNGTDDNGNLRSSQFWNGGGPGTNWIQFNQTYTYDGVNRLKTATDTGWSRAYCYDAYGNMWVTGYSVVVPAGNTPQEIGGPCPSGTTPYLGNNRINGASYDSVGNQTVVNDDTLTYNSENRVTSAYDPVTHNTEDYLYDGDGRRVEKSIVGGTSTTYVYDAFGNLTAEYGAMQGNPPCTTCYLSYDWLGTVRMVTDASGTVKARHDFLPFGQEIQGGIAGRNGPWGSTSDVEQKFTGKIRDQETGLDYFGARYYGNALGRFTSPDPGNTGSDPRDPQSWNAYAYTGNNPLSRVDSDGLAYSVCTNDENGHEQCSYIANDHAAEAALSNPGAGLSASNGKIYAADENGNEAQVGTYQHIFGPSDTQGIQVDYGFDLAVMGALRGVASALEGSAGSAVARSALWSMAPTARGGVVEEMLGANLPRTFPTIDRFANGIATSIKSVDLTAASYQAPSALESRLMGYVEKLANFPGGALAGTEVRGAQVAGRVLKLAVPEGASTAQQAVISRVTAAAAQKGVQVVVVTVK